jgi:hypothetical protein
VSAKTSTGYKGQVALLAALCELTIIPVFVKLVVKDELPLCVASVLWPVAVGTVLACREVVEQQRQRQFIMIQHGSLSTGSSTKHFIVSSRCTDMLAVEARGAAACTVVCAMNLPQFASEGNGDGLDTAGACST